MKADDTLTTQTTSSEDETFQRTSTRSGQFKPPLKKQVTQKWKLLR